MTHPQGTIRGMIAKGAISVGAQNLTVNSTSLTLSGSLLVSGKTVGALSANSTGAIVGNALFIGAGANTKITANTTGMTLSNALYVSGKTAGALTANTTGLIVANALRVGTKTFYFTSNSTGVLLNGKYITTNTTGN